MFPAENYFDSVKGEKTYCSKLAQNSFSIMTILEKMEIEEKKTQAL